MAVTQTANGAPSTIQNGVAEPTQPGPAELDVGRPHAPLANVFTVC